MSRSRAPRAKFVFAASLALSLAASGALTSACAVHAPSVGPTSPPPAPRQVQVDYRPGYAWVDGHWTWSYDQWVWQPGYWVRARPGYYYQRGRWEKRGESYVYVEGRWQRGQQPSSRDYRRAVRPARATR